MKNKQNKTGSSSENLPGYPVYPASEDIFNAGKEESDLDPEDPHQVKPFEKITDGPPEELVITDDLSSVDLDVPGSEDDDAMEDIGSEDEENNFYSLGGDNHD